MSTPSSTSSSRSASPDLQPESMQIFVKNLSGDKQVPDQNPAIPITVPSNTTVSNLTHLVSLRTSTPTDSLRLVHAGRHLSPSSTLLSNNITRDSTVHVAASVRGGMPPRKRITCTLKDCKDKALPIVGDCGFCNKNFCGKHRLLEDHKCDGLESVSFPSCDSAVDEVGPESGRIEWWQMGLGDVISDIMADDNTCRKESHERNAAQLNAERTQVIRGI
ncbi:an1-type zinc finger protein [Rutstroemia sp. NJR-2017a WRK4]|nr:an1-type zinc finger protein [Rutstroemia sp. NJR-2017a WRK4]